MAILYGNKILRSDINSIYSSFNTFISNYGGSIAQLGSAPAVGDEVDDATVTALNTKINNFKTDEYLSTQASWWITASVAEGSYIRDDDLNNIQTTVNNFSRVKCRNKAYNSYGSNNQGSKNNGKNSNGCSFTYCGSNGYNHNGTCSARSGGGACSNGMCSNNIYNGTCSEGNCTANGTCSSYGTCKQGQYIDITNAYTNA